MMFTVSNKISLFLFLSFFVFLGSDIARAQQMSPNKAAPGTGKKHLNKIFSSTSDFGPLNKTKNIAPINELLLFWSEPGSGGDGSADGYYFQIMSYLQGQTNVPANQRLVDGHSNPGTGGFLSNYQFDSATSNYRYPAISVNKHSVVLCGDMNGNGYDEVAAVWQNKYGNYGYGEVWATAKPVDKDNLNFPNNTVAADSVGFITPALSNYDGKICAKLADLNGNGRKELIVAFHDPAYNKVDIDVYDWSNSITSHLKRIAKIDDTPVYNTKSWSSLISLATGDFNQDGRDEIALSGFTKDGQLYIKLYKLDSNNDLVAEGEKDFNGYHDNEVSQLVMAAGDFNGDAYDDIALTETSSGSSNAGTGKSIIYIAQPDTSLGDIHVSADSSATKYSIENTGGNLPATSLDCGDLNGNGKDEIVLGAMNDVAVFEADTNGTYLKPVFKSKTNVTGIEDSGDYKYSYSFLKVGALSQSSTDTTARADIVVLRNQYTDEGTSARQALDITALRATGNNFDLTVMAQKTGYMPETTSIDPRYRRHYALALGDFNGAGLRLGQPRHFRKTDIVQPLVILNAPPIHFDVLNDTSYDVDDCFSGNGCNFSATYDHKATNNKIMKTSVSSSWGIDASISSEGGADFGVKAKVKNSMNFHYGHNFSKIHNSSEENTVEISEDATVDDRIYAITTSYDLWEYPVYDSGQLKGHLLVSVPAITEHEWMDGNSWSAYSYIPNHVVGNILSYRTYGNLNNPYSRAPIKGDTTKDNKNTFELVRTSSANTPYPFTNTWSLSFKDFTSNSVKTTQNYSLKVGRSEEAGADFGIASATVKASVSGNYSHTKLNAHTSSVTNALNLSVNLGRLNPAVGEDEYDVTPYAYWSKDGALILDYAARPELAQPGYTETWWQQKYGHAPDPALALPFRWYPEMGLPIQNPAKRYQTKEIIFNPKNPSPGSVVKTFLRIHNYSLIPTDTSVGVSFYIGDPDQGGTIIKSTSGDSIFYTHGDIANRGSDTLSFKWRAPSEVNGKFLHNGDYARIYAVVDPQNKIKEIHEDNNKGWNVLEIPGVATAIEKKSDSQLPTTVKLYPAYPNPFNPTTTIHYVLPAVGNVKLTVYDVLGRRVAQLVNGRQTAGNHEIRFNASQLASGVYFYRLRANNVVRTGKMMLIK